MQRLETLRSKLGPIDEELVKLLNHRFEIVQEIGRLKREQGLPIYQPQREVQVIEALKGVNQGPMTSKHLQTLFTEIMSVSRSLQRSMKVAYLGPEGSYTHQSALAMFGQSTELVPLPDLQSVFREVESGRSELGVVPVENTTEGVVTGTLDLLMSSPTTICSEHVMPVRHNLLVAPNTVEVRTVYSHPQVFAQCRNWLAVNMPSVELHETSSTTAAARLAVERPGSAAIASEVAASIYGLEIRHESIEDHPDNTTRFIAIGLEGPRRSGRDKTSLRFSLRDRAGALNDALQVFKASNISLTMIQSRPSPDRNWEYVFFVDLIGHQEEEHVAKALQQLKQECQTFRVLGSYPRSQ